AGDRLAAALERFDALHGRPHQLLDAREAAAALLLTDLEDFLLGLIEQFCSLRPPFERFADDRRGDFDQATKQRFLADYPRVELDVCRRGHRVDEKRDV